jgi:hypothetical protein
MKFIKKNWQKLVSIFVSFLVPVISFAADLNGSTTPTATTCADGTSAVGKICNPIPNVTSVPSLIQTILNGLLTIGIPIVALAIIYCGFLFVFARGNSEKLTKAKDALLYTLIGAAVLLGAWAIATMIQSTVMGLSDSTTGTGSTTPPPSSGGGSTTPPPSSGGGSTTPPPSSGGGSTIPGAPTISTATAGNAQAIVAFTTPSSNGGATITSYTITTTSSSGTKTITTGSTSPITVTGLTNGTPYTFTVAATNSVGTGTVSMASNAVIPTTMLLSTNIGPYYWGGTLTGVSSDDMISKAATLALSLNSKIIRISMIPTSDTDYKGGSCISNFTLAGLAARSDFNQIISDPQYSTIVITAFDGVSYKDCKFNAEDPTFYTPDNTQKIETEYHDLAIYLAKFNKTFIIAPWEGDNEIYCGAAYYDDLQSCPGATNYMIGFQKWMQARSAGIASAGTSNVFSGVEFNIVHALKDKGLPSVLYDVLPNVSADYYLYSAYESSNVSAEQLGSDIDLIRSVLTSEGKDPSHLIIGELGNTDPTQMKNLIAMVKQKNILYTFIWALLDNPPGMGIYDTDGNLSPIGKAVFPSQ